MDLHLVKNVILEMDNIEPNILELLNISTGNSEYTTIIGVIDSDSYKYIVKDSDITWKYKFINIALNLKEKIIINFSIVVTDKLYKLPNIYNKKLVIYIYIDNDTIMYNSLYFISNFIKKSLLSALTK